MVSWCWASLYKISHLSDISLCKKTWKIWHWPSNVSKQDIRGRTCWSHRTALLFSYFFFCTRQWCRTVFHQWIFSLQLTTQSGSLTSVRSSRLSLQCPMYCRHYENHSEINWTQNIHGEEKKGQVTSAIMFKESVCMCLCGWSTEHACDWLVCLVCVCVCVCVCWIGVRVGRDAQTDCFGTDVHLSEQLELTKLKGLHIVSTRHRVLLMSAYGSVMSF